MRSIFWLVRCFEEENNEDWNVRQRAVVESEKLNLEAIKALIHGLPASARLENSTTEYSAYDKAKSPAELDKSVENFFEGQNGSTNKKLWLSCSDLACQFLA